MSQQDEVSRPAVEPVLPTSRLLRVGFANVYLRNRKRLHAAKMLRPGLSAVAAVVNLDGLPVSVLAVHLPSAFEAGRSAWRRSHELLERMTQKLPQPIVVIGDFNSLTQQRPMRDLRRRGFVDVRDASRSDGGGSWPAWLPVLRLDHAFVTSPLRPRFITDFAVPGSDHHGLIIEVGLASGPIAIDCTAAASGMRSDIEQDQRPYPAKVTRPTITARPVVARGRLQ